MTITLTPLCDSAVAPASFLLSIDSANILLDCGVYDHPPTADPSSSTATQSSEQHAALSAYLLRLKELAPTLDLVLLSHPLLSSVGLLPWLRARCGLRCPVYATLPTREMGRYAVQEWVEAKTLEERNRARDVRQAGAGGAGGAAGPSWAKKGKMIATELAGEDEEMEEKAVVVGEGSEDVWSEVWQLRMSEVRDAFLGVNAVRWTQPVHLTGKPLSLSIIQLSYIGC